MTSALVVILVIVILCYIAWLFYYNSLMMSFLKEVQRTSPPGSADLLNHPLISQILQKGYTAINNTVLADVARYEKKDVMLGNQSSGQYLIHKPVMRYLRSAEFKSVADSNLQNKGKRILYIYYSGYVLGVLLLGALVAIGLSYSYNQHIKP